MMRYEHMRFKRMSDVQDAGDRMAAKLSTLLSLEELKDLAELVDANAINQDLWSSLLDEVEKREASASVGTIRAHDEGDDTSI